VALTLALTFTLPAVRQVSQPVAAQLAADAGD
jgi:hypothetical protein